MSEPDLLTLLATETLGDFECRQIILLGKTKPVYVMGTGPAVIVMSEMPGICCELRKYMTSYRQSWLLPDCCVA